MKLPEPLNRFLRVPRLSFGRIIGALAIAAGADGLQLFTGFLGWAGIDQGIDVVTMIVIAWLIGFHVLLLPTFVLELMPVLDDLPTWTACTIVVIIMRRREQRALPPPTKPTIDI